jgi:DNA-binding beta-propeller fold protein YncE
VTAAVQSLTFSFFTTCFKYTLTVSSPSCNVAANGADRIETAHPRQLQVHQRDAACIGLRVALLLTVLEYAATNNQVSSDVCYRHLHTGANVQIFTWCSLVIGAAAIALSQPAGGQVTSGGVTAATLPYKSVDWPVEATSAAGFGAAWNFIQAASVAVTARGHVLVLHRGAHPMLEFESNGAFIHPAIGPAFSEGKVAGIAEKNWTPDRSRYSAVYGPPGCDSCGAHAVRVDPEGNIWVVDAAGHVVYKLNEAGKELMRLGTRGVSGSSQTAFNLPTDVAFGPAGDIYVSDGYGGARVVKYSRTGKYLLEWGKRGDGPGEFRLPHNVAVDTQGRVYVSDRDNQRIEVFDADGRYLAEWKGTGAVSGMAITKDGHIWTGVVLRDLNGQALGQLPGAASPHGVAVADSGDVYLAQLSGVVQKFVKR